MGSNKLRRFTVTLGAIAAFPGVRERLGQIVSSWCAFRASLVLAILRQARRSANQGHGPEWRGAPSRATPRPQAGALLTVILIGSRLERREDGLPRVSAMGGIDGGQLVTGGAWGSALAAARRAPKGAKAELPARLWRESRGRLRPPRRARPRHRIARQGAPDRA
jgi:hypothetical protein